MRAQEAMAAGAGEGTVTPQGGKAQRPKGHLLNTLEKCKKQNPSLVPSTQR